jgi:RNA-directed DNA polymerase
LAQRRQLRAQDGRCAICRALLLHADRQPQHPHEWEQWLATTRKAIVKQYIVVREDGTTDASKPRLVHAHCQRRHTARQQGPALLTA